MINDNTIISSFNDRPTLLEWLKKVEEALKSDTATAFHVNNRGNATLTFSIDFADGSSIESEPIVLQQGESINGATIRNGHLYLSLTNGDEIDAGAIFSGNVVINGDFEAMGTATLPILNSKNSHIEAIKPVIEVMTGYSFTSSSSANLEKTIAYAGIAKNGNKLTFSIFAKLKRMGTIPNSSIILGSFGIPSSIGEKLIPIKNTWLETKSLYFSSNYASGVNLPSLVNKPSNTRLDFNIYDVNTLMVENTEYTVRFETTLLLSENLAAL